MSWLGPDPRASASYVPTPRGPSRSEEAQARTLEGTATFAVTATFMGTGRRARHNRRKGELFISPDAIVFLSRDIGEATRFEHTERDITLVKGRLWSPWANTFVLLRGKGATVRVAAPISARHGLRRALRDAGVIVHEQSSSRTPGLPGRAGRRT